MSTLQVIFVDNFDSFTFNLVDEFQRRGADVSVYRNDQPASKLRRVLEESSRPRLLVISPGPGKPSDAGCCFELLKTIIGKVPIFGVCLGHQAVVEVCGGRVASAGEIVHGKSDWVICDPHPIFEGLPQRFLAARYHSLAAEVMPDCLSVIARTGKVVMALSHRIHPVVGVQFHPESILTPMGGRMIDNVMKWAMDAETKELSAQSHETAC